MVKTTWNDRHEEEFERRQHHGGDRDRERERERLRTHHVRLFEDIIRVVHSELLPDLQVVREGVRRGGQVDEMADHPRPLQVPQENSAEALPHVRIANQPWEVRHYSALQRALLEGLRLLQERRVVRLGVCSLVAAPVARQRPRQALLLLLARAAAAVALPRRSAAPDDPKVRHESCEGVVRDVGPGHGDGAQQRGLPGVRQSDQANVGLHPQDQVYLSPLPLPSVRNLLPVQRVRGGRRALVEAPAPARRPRLLHPETAIAPQRNKDPLPGGHQLGGNVGASTGSLGDDGGADRNPNGQRRRGPARRPPRRRRVRVRTVLGSVVVPLVKVQQVVVALVGLDVDAPAPPALAGALGRQEDLLGLLTAGLVLEVLYRPPPPAPLGLLPLLSYLALPPYLSPTSATALQRHESLVEPLVLRPRYELLPLLRHVLLAMLLLPLATRLCFSPPSSPRHGRRMRRCRGDGPGDQAPV